jgi:2-polyprenyl-6-methoxyphenol hydroxylase-like FAD-dependent oxidoreductase
VSRAQGAIVVGAGIVGAACALELARSGLRVLVVDSRFALALLLGWDELDSVRAPLEPAPLSTLAELGAAAPTASIPCRHRGD